MPGSAVVYTVERGSKRQKYTTYNNIQAFTQWMDGSPTPPWPMSLKEPPQRYSVAVEVQTAGWLTG